MADFLSTKNHLNTRICEIEITTIISLSTFSKSSLNSI